MSEQEPAIDMAKRMRRDPTAGFSAVVVGHVLTVLFWYEITATWIGLPMIAFAWLGTAIWVVGDKRYQTSGRGLRASGLIAGVVILSYGPVIGTYSKLWRQQSYHLELAEQALLHAAEGREFRPDDEWIEVDMRGDQPVRVAICWSAWGGDWDGIVYDPSHRVATGPPGAWPGIGTLHAWHVWGPWFRASN